MSNARVKWMFNKRVRRTMEQIVEEAMGDETNALNDALEGIIAASGGSGGGAIALPSWWTWDYDNRTAGAGTEPEGNYTIYDYAMVGGLIFVGESGKRITHLGTRVVTGAVGATARISLYAAEGNTTAPSLAGTLLEDAGTVSVASTGEALISMPSGIPVDPGFYWVLIEPSAEITIAGFTSFAGYLGQNPATGDVYSGMSYNISGDPLDPHPDLLNGGDRTATAPLVLFRIDDVL